MPAVTREAHVRHPGPLRWVLLVLVWLWTAGGSLALEPGRPLSNHAHRVFRSEEGLLQDAALALLEGRDGYLWIGTSAGLLRFDGAFFETYSRLNVPGFVHNEVQCLAQEPDGALWIGTRESGLYRFQKGSVRAYGLTEGLPDQPIRHLLRDRQGILWASPTEGPLLRFDGGSFHPVESAAAHLEIRALTEDREGILWVGTASSGLWRLKQGRLVLAALAPEITALDTGLDGTLWVGTRTQGLQQFEEGRLQTPAWARSLPSKPISHLLLDRHGSLWVGLEQGGLFRHTASGRLETTPGAPGSRWTPRALMEDSSGALWWGTADRGMGVIYPVPFRPIPLLDADPEEPVSMVCQDPAGEVWCLTGDQSLGHLLNGHLQRKIPKSAFDGPLSALWPRQAGGLWLGTRKGEILVLDQGQIHRQSWSQTSQPEPVLSIYEDPQGTLWVAKAHQGLVKVAPGQAPLHLPSIQGVVAMTGGGPDPLYLANRTMGLGLLAADQARWLGRAEGLGSSGAQALHLDAKGNLWIGTPDGLRRYRNGGFQSVVNPPEALQVPIHAILEDPGERLWLSTGQGVLRIPLAALLKGLRQPTLLAPVVYDHHDGMPSRETFGGAQPAAWLSREGEFYFPTIRGLCRLGGNLTTPPGPPIRLHLLRAESDETVLPEGTPIHVPSGTHRFEVYYTATSLTRADKIRFRYRLEGWDRLWSDVGDRRFSAYSNLPPGSYRFVVQAWRLDDDAPPSEQSVAVVVEPFLFQRPAFWALCALALAAFAWWLLRLRLQQVEARSAVLAERNRMAREIHDHLAQGFTGVLLQLEAAEAKLGHMAGDPAPVLTRLDHARNLAVASLQEARRSVMSLSPRKLEGMDLLGALRSLADRLLAGTEIQVELVQTGQPRPIPPRLEEELLRMAQELFTNALRHGKAHWVRTVLQFEGRHIHLSVEDDGQGFDPTASAAGYGMRSIRESLRKWRGHMDIDSSPGFGTRITLTLPLRRWPL